MHECFNTMSISAGMPCSWSTEYLKIFSVFFWLALHGISSLWQCLGLQEAQTLLENSLMSIKMLTTPFFLWHHFIFKEWKKPNKFWFQKFKIFLNCNISLKWQHFIEQIKIKLIFIEQIKIKLNVIFDSVKLSFVWLLQINGFREASAQDLWIS